MHSGVEYLTPACVRAAANTCQIKTAIIAARFIASYLQRHGGCASPDISLLVIETTCPASAATARISEIIGNVSNGEGVGD